MSINSLTDDDLRFLAEVSPAVTTIHGDTGFIERLEQAGIIFRYRRQPDIGGIRNYGHGVIAACRRLLDVKVAR